MVSIVGSVLALLALVYGAYLSFVYLVDGHDISGWTTIVVSLMLFAGIQLIFLGLVGEYIGRIFEEVKARPLYVVRSRVGHGMKKSTAQCPSRQLPTAPRRARWPWRGWHCSYCWAAPPGHGP